MKAIGTKLIVEFKTETEQTETEKSESGIIIEKPKHNSNLCYGTVTSVGEKVTEISVGDTVAFKYDKNQMYGNFTKVEKDDKIYLILNDSDVEFVD